MRFNWNKKYNTIAIYSIIVLCISIIFYLIVSEVGLVKIQIGRYLSVFQPIFIGLAMAYIFNFILRFYEKRLINKLVNEEKKGNLIRPFGLILTYATVLILLVLFLNFILPQLILSVKGLVNKIPYYFNSLDKMISGLNISLNLPKDYSALFFEKWEEVMEKILNFGTGLIPMLGNLTKSVVSSIWNIVLGVIVSIYILIDKERFAAVSKKLIASIFSPRNTEIILGLVVRADTIFGSFLGGKMLDSLIVGVLSFLIFSLFKIPYTLLISFIIGITNIIPFFGPFIGAVPSFFIILFEEPVKAFTFLVLILIIQQIDGNIIGPKILGDSLGISAFWILFSLLVAGKLLGFIGMIIGVPLFVFIYSIIKDIVEYKLEKKGLPVDTEDYY